MNKIKYYLLTFILLSNIFLFAQEDSSEIDIVDYNVVEFATKARPGLEMAAVVRLQSKAIAQLRLSNLDITDNITIKDIQNNSIIGSVNRINNNIYLHNLPLNSEFNIIKTDIDGNETIITNISTNNLKSEPIEVSDEFIEKINLWTSLEDETKPNIYDYVNNLESVSIMEKLYFIQRFKGNSEQIFPDILADNEDHGGPPILPSNDFEFLNYKDLGPLTIPYFELFDPTNPCNCQYILKIKRNIFKGFPNKAQNKNDYDHINHGLEYFGDGSDVFAHLEEWNNGPSKRHLLRIRVSKIGVGTRTKTKGTESIQNPNLPANLADINKSELFWLLLCDKNYLGGPVPSSCTCEKTLTLNYRYDTKLSTDSKYLRCLCGTRGSAAIAEDWASVVIQKGKDLPFVLASNKAEMTSKCNDQGNLHYIMDLVNIGAAVASIAVMPPSITPATLAANKAAAIPLITSGITSLTNLFQTPVSDCQSGEASKTLLDNSYQVTFKANEPVSISMYSAQLMQVSGTRSGEAKSEITSDYFISGTITTNSTSNELKYCCMKKVGTYNMGSYNEAPLPLQTLQDQLGFELDKVGPWYPPYDQVNPRMWNAIVVPYEVHTFFGNTGCDMVQIQARLQNTTTNNNNLEINQNLDPFFKLVPNPTSEYFNILSNTTNFDQVDIIDINGNTIESFKNVDKSHQFNINNYSKGQYYIRIVLKDKVQILKLTVI